MTVEYPEVPGMARPTTYSHVARVGGLVFIAGQTATDSQGRVVGPGDPVAQAHQVYRNIQTALAAVRATMADVTQMTTFVTDMRYRQAISDVRRQYFRAPYPPNTLVGVTALANEQFLIEISATAAMPAG